MPTSIFDSLGAFPHALAAGLLIAVVCSCLGVLVVLKRMVFIGITLSEVAAVGIALSMLLHLPPLLGASLLTLSVVVLLALDLEPARLPKDALMGIIFVAASAVAVLVVAGSGFGLHEIKRLLYGDLILTSPGDLALMALVLIPVLAAVVLFIRPIFYSFLDREAAKVLGIRVVRWELLFFCCLGLAVSAASKAAGTLLVFCYQAGQPGRGIGSRCDGGRARPAERIGGAPPLRRTPGSGLQISLLPCVDYPPPVSVRIEVGHVLVGQQVLGVQFFVLFPRQSSPVTMKGLSSTTSMACRRSGSSSF